MIRIRFSGLAEPALWGWHRLSPALGLRQAVAALTMVWVASVLTACTGAGYTAASTPSSVATWYLHYQCGAQTQCAADFGTFVGIQTTFTTLAACQAAQSSWMRSNTMQPFSAATGVGDWCDTNPNPAEPHP
jgi:hypothetical protein